MYKVFEVNNWLMRNLKVGCMAWNKTDHSAFCKVNICTAAQIITVQGSNKEAVMEILIRLNNSRFSQITRLMFCIIIFWHVIYYILVNVIRTLEMLRYRVCCLNCNYV